MSNIKEQFSWLSFSEIDKPTFEKIDLFLLLNDIQFKKKYHYELSDVNEFEQLKEADFTVESFKDRLKLVDIGLSVIEPEDVLSKETKLDILEELYSDMKSRIENE